MVVEMVPLKGGIGSIFHPPEGNIQVVYKWGPRPHFQGSKLAVIFREGNLEDHPRYRKYLVTPIYFSHDSRPWMEGVP